jgi:hypothetical protein
MNGFEENSRRASICFWQSNRASISYGIGKLLLKYKSSKSIQWKPKATVANQGQIYKTHKIRQCSKRHSLYSLIPFCFLLQFSTDVHAWGKTISTSGRWLALLNHVTCRDWTGKTMTDSGNLEYKKYLLMRQSSKSHESQVRVPWLGKSNCQVLEPMAILRLDKNPLWHKNWKMTLSLASKLELPCGTDQKTTLKDYTEIDHAWGEKNPICLQYDK